MSYTRAKGESFQFSDFDMSYVMGRSTAAKTKIHRDIFPVAELIIRLPLKLATLAADWFLTCEFATMG